jgi:hypothetical protein
MTAAKAPATIRQIGTVENSASKLKLRIPERSRAVLQTAIETLRNGKAETLVLLENLRPTRGAGSTMARSPQHRSGNRNLAKLQGGAACGRDFVSISRYGANRQVIRRTNRKITRNWRELDE